MEKKTHICKICNRSFGSGKAIGGHMRSHFAKLPLPPKPHSPPPAISISSSSSSSLPLHSPHNPSQSFRSINHDLYNSKPDLNLPPAHPVNGDAEIDSPKSIATTRRRSKRRRKVLEKVSESGAVRLVESSTERATTVPDEIIMKDEDVALCLLMLSNDSKGKQKVSDENEAEMELAVEAEEDEDELLDEFPLRSKSKARYRCETCQKYFRSYQALGGHKASHKKVKKEDGIEIPGSSSAVSADQRIFKCPFCDKVFESGQALGGHKKVHLSCLGITNADHTATTSDPKPKPTEILFDLNLPAPEEDDDDDDVVEL